MAKPGESPPTFRDGERLGNYVITRLVGRGGMADVYKAVRLDTREFVAVKTIKPALRDDPMYLEMFLEEGRLGLLLDHPNLVRTIEVNQEAAAPLIVMEYVAGVDLARILRHIQKLNERLSFCEAAYIAHGVANALAWVHDLRDETGRPLNLVNRDVSPQNVRIGFDGSVKVFDFGIARNAQRFAPEIGFVKGKQRYMSPEQIRGLPLDARSDIFSFGIVLHELLTGRPLFANQNQFQVADAITSARIDPPSKTAARTPPDLDEVCMRCLKQRPEDRIDSLSVVLGALASGAGDLGTSRRNLSAYVESSFPSELAHEHEDAAQISSPRGRAKVTTAEVPSVVGTDSAQTEFFASRPSDPEDEGEDAEPEIAVVPEPQAPPRRPIPTAVLLTAVAAAGLVSFLLVWLLAGGS
jgi:serine/threonine-protein kinase